MQISCSCARLPSSMAMFPQQTLSPAQTSIFHEQQLRPRVSVTSVRTCVSLFVFHVVLCAVLVVTAQHAKTLVTHDLFLVWTLL